MANPSFELTTQVDFTLPEEAVATQLGLSRKVVAEHRGSEGGRWGYGPNRRILWSPAGVETLQHELAGKIENAPSLPAGLTVLVVTRVGFVNRKVLLAQAENAPGVDLNVYLGNNGDSLRFQRGQKILARFRRGATWDFEGNPERPQDGRRMPRYAGKW
jgi:hypothetical protein